MKLRAAVSVLAIVAALTACSSSSKKGSPSAGNPAPGTGVAGTSVGAAPGGTGSAAGFCAKLKTDTAKLGSLTTAGNSGDFTALKAQLGQEISTFQDLGNGAPAQVKPAIDDIVTGLQSAQQALADPSNPDVSKLQALGTKLPADVSQLTSYISANCH